MSRLGIPGLSLAVGAAGEVVHETAFGFASVENEVKAAADTVYRLASVSKPITAVAALRLAARRELDLDAPAWRYCSAYPPKPWAVTPRLLLSHQGGVRGYRPAEPTQTRRFDSVAEGVALFASDPLAYEPGTAVAYSTYGYNLLGDGQLLNSRLADMSHKVPGGGLIGTAPDVARFGTALASGRLVGRTQLEQMLTPQRTRSGRAIGFGLGLAVGRRGGRREAWHMGGQEQVSTIFYLRPDSQLVVAMLSNLEHVQSELLDLARRVADLAEAQTVFR
jgi:CubicO group peptidase (beta-lactamase class C family)